jgi:2-haloacid dehalogenase
MPIPLPLNRRRFLSVGAGAAVATAVATAVGTAAVSGLRYKAVVFDAFPIFDPRPVARLAEEFFPGVGTAFINAWRTRQFEYQWLRALSGQYVDFMQTTEDSLGFAARQTGVELTPQARTRLLGAYGNLTIWPDVAAALRALHDAGARLGMLSNMTKGMLETGLAQAGLGGLFEHVLSTDQLKTYKPAPAAYQMAIDAFALSRAEILFVPFAGWDVAGGKWFGYPTFWVNRLGSPAEGLGVTPDAVGPDLNALVKFVLGS